MSASMESVRPASRVLASDPSPEAVWHKNDRGEFELRNPDGRVVAQVLLWPHWRGDWLSNKAAEDWRDSGMKRYRTARGALAYLCRKLNVLPPEPSAGAQHGPATTDPTP